MKNISIIMRSCNDIEYIEDTLKMVFSQTIKDFELINLDNSSTDGTLEIIKKYNKKGKIISIPKGKYVPGKALNKGVSAAKGEIIVFLNSDAAPVDEYWLENLINGLGKEIVAVYGRQAPRKDAHPLVCLDYERAYPKSKNKIFMRNLMFSFASAAFYKKIWNKFKFYDFKVGYSEDLEWCSRLIKNNYSIKYIPDSVVFHSHNLALKKLFYKSYWEHFSASIIYSKKLNILIFFKRYVASIMRDFIYCLKQGKLFSFLNSPFYRSTIFLSSYLGWKNGLKEFNKL
jgi:rhamnosyltransferase